MGAILSPQFLALLQKMMPKRDGQKEAKEVVGVT
jgi:hypothetical protein